MCDDTKFSVMASLFTWMQKSNSAAKKKSKFRKFLDNFCKPGDYFNAIRLILPALDRERGTYGLKESVLTACLVDALGMSRESEDALRLFNWRKGGAAKAGPNAGNFSLVAYEVLQRRQGSASGGLTIKELNKLFDRLASSENRAGKTAVLSELIHKTNAQEMKWIIMIILKDLKLGVSEKSIFHEFHPDAEDLFNVTCDLKLVCEKLRNRNQRHKRQDIEVGKPVRPQLAMRVGNANAAWKKLHGKEVVVECKFDGDRIQIHKNGQEIHFFSRSFLDHPEYEHGMSDVIVQNILVDRCILDGEMLVWDTSMNRFAEFGSNQEIAKAAKEGLDIDRQLCYVAFDILYVGDTSVIHQTLKERHELLRKVVKPLKGRLEILVPSGGLNDRLLSGEPCWSLMAQNVDEVERFFKETIENRDEGIVLKDLGSKWEPSDRSAKWLKLKPEYIRPGSDLDVLIIGGYYGSGRHGGEVAQFLVGLAERAAPNAYPRRVGSGLSDDERDAVVTKLKPYFRKNEYPKKAPPSFYQVTNNSKERPDVWVESPEKSIILSITSDIRTISSEVFAAPYSLRFPRIDRVRYDKPWHECLDVQSFVQLVNSSNGTTHRGGDYRVAQENKPQRVNTSRKGEKKNVSVVPSQFVQTDVSGVKGASLIFSNMRFYFVNVPPTHSLDSLHKMVVENGGSFSMNMNTSVTHSIAAESKGIKFQAAKLRGDVIHCSWLFDCCSQRKLLPLQPKYFISLSDFSRKKLQEEIDEFSDPYYWDLDIEDIKQLLSNINRSENFKRIDHYKMKYCPKDKWSRFQGCSIYFYPLTQTLNSEFKVLTEFALRRMKLEVSMGGGRVSNNVKLATHIVVVSPLKLTDFDKVLRSLEEARYAMEVVRPIMLVTDECSSYWYSKLQKESIPFLKWHVFTNASVLTPEALKKCALKYRSLNYSHAPDGAAIICFTSGTTGRPKGVTISHSTLIMQSLAKVAIVGYCEDDVYLHTAPLCHIGGISSAMAMLMVGARHILIPKFDAKSAIEAIEEFSVSSFITVPAIMADMLSIIRKKETWKGKQTVKKILNGGGGLSIELIKDATIYFSRAKLLSAYGMTETCSSLTFLMLHDPERENSNHLSLHVAGAVCVGKPAPHIEIKIGVEGSSGLGRILTRGLHVMLGYWGDLPTKASNAGDDEGWLDTGDIGQIDDYGNIWLVGRSKGRIKSGGENVYPEEVEAILSQHPGVYGVVAVGVPDTRLTEMVVACVQLRENWRWIDLHRDHSSESKSKTLSGDILQQFCRDKHLTGFKIPKVFIIWRKQFPLTTTGKLRRDEVRSEVISCMHFLPSNL